MKNDCETVLLDMSEGAHVWVWWCVRVWMWWCACVSVIVCVRECDGVRVNVIVCVHDYDDVRAWLWLCACVS